MGGKHVRHHRCALAERTDVACRGNMKRSMLKSGVRQSAEFERRSVSIVFNPSHVILGHAHDGIEVEPLVDG